MTQVLDRHTTKDVLCAILHSILFHRLFGTVKPRTVEVLDVTMVSDYSSVLLHLHFG
jgi:autophagy-related protein 101